MLQTQFESNLLQMRFNRNEKPILTRFEYDLVKVSDRGLKRETSFMLVFLTYYQKIQFLPELGRWSLVNNNSNDRTFIVQLFTVQPNQNLRFVFHKQKSANAIQQIVCIKVSVTEKIRHMEFLFYAFSNSSIFGHFQI